MVFMVPYAAMSKVSILGSGELGSTVAQKLAGSDWPGAIWLLDTDAGAAKGRALDLLESNSVVRSGTRLHGSGQTAEIEGSNYVVVAETEALSDFEASRILSSVENAARDAVILVALSEPASLLRLISKLDRIDPRRVLGTAPEALASLWRLHIARKFGCSPRDVQVSILGFPCRNGLHEVFASIAGQAIEHLLSPTDLRDVAAMASRRPRPGPRALASAAAAILQDMILKNGAVRSCFAWANGAYRAGDLFLCAPVVLNPHGLEKILELRLEPRQEVTLSRSLDHLARALC